MVKINILLDSFDVDSCFRFNLTRRTGKKIYLAKGNEMISSNDRLHHAPKAMLTAHLRELGGIFGQKFKKQNNITNGECIYTDMKPCHIIVVVNPPTLSRMDAPNWYPTIKGLIDGLTDANIFSDDNDDVVKSITFMSGEKTTNGKYLLELNIIKGEKPHVFRQATFDEMLEFVGPK